MCPLLSHENARWHRLNWSTPCSKWSVNRNILNQFLEIESTIQPNRFPRNWWHFYLLLAEHQSEAFFLSKAILLRKFMTSSAGSCNQQQLDVPDQNYCFCRDYSFVWVLSILRVPRIGSRPGMWHPLRSFLFLLAVWRKPETMNEWKIVCDHNCCPVRLQLPCCCGLFLAHVTTWGFCVGEDGTPLGELWLVVAGGQLSS